jgi:hypothetical protein
MCGIHVSDMDATTNFDMPGDIRCHLNCATTLQHKGPVWSQMRVGEPRFFNPEEDISAPNTYHAPVPAVAYQAGFLIAISLLTTPQLGQ